MRLGKSNLSAVEKITIVLMNLLHQPISALFHQDIILHIQAVYQWQVRSMHSLIRVWFLNPFRFPNSQCGAYNQQKYKYQCCFCVELGSKYCSHRIESPYHSISHLLQKSEAFQSVHHVTFILCYTVLYNFFGLRCRFGRHRAEVHRTSCALAFSLIRVSKH